MHIIYLSHPLVPSQRTFQGTGQQHLQHILKSNIYVLGNIEEVVGRTRWPAAHDKVVELKQVIATLISVLRDKMEAFEESFDERHMRHMAPQDSVQMNKCAVVVLCLWFPVVTVFPPCRAVIRCNAR